MTPERPTAITTSHDECDTVHTLLWRRGQAKGDDRDRIGRILAALADLPGAPTDGTLLTWRLPARDADRAYLAGVLRTAAREAQGTRAPIVYIDADQARQLAGRISPSPPLRVRAEGRRGRDGRRDPHAAQAGVRP